MASRIPIYVLTGFLGSGKTVLLNALLRHEGFSDSAIVVNEFGEIGLDHLLVSTAQENIVLLDAGCLCCTVLGSLKETLADLDARRAHGELPPFARVLIETTGLADPASIVRSIVRDPIISRLYRLAGVLCTVDAVFGEAQMSDHAEARSQVAFADRLVVTKTDRLPSGAVPPALAARLRALNPTAELLSATNGAIPPAVLLGTEESASVTPPWLGRLGPPVADASTASHDHDGTVHESMMGAECFWFDRPASWAGLAAWTEVLRRRYGRDMLRCKGIVGIAGLAGPVVVHGVQNAFDTYRLSAWPDAERGSRLVIIGRNLDRAVLEDALEWLFVPEGTMPPLDIRAEPSAKPFLAVLE